MYTLYIQREKMPRPHALLVQNGFTHKYKHPIHLCKQHNIITHSQIISLKYTITISLSHSHSHSVKIVKRSHYCSVENSWKRIEVVCTEQWAQTYLWNETEKWAMCATIKCSTSKLKKIQSTRCTFFFFLEQLFK